MKKRHQVQVTIKEAEIIRNALFWYMQYINYNDIVICKEIFDKYSRIHQILYFYKTLDHGDKTKLHNDHSESKTNAIRAKTINKVRTKRTGTN